MAIASERATDTLTGAEAAVEMLKAHGVEILFGLCGDTSLPFYDALARLPHGMRHILARDERSAAYMADGYARVSGKVGVCEGPSGGGVTYILPGLAEANESSVPLLCINSDISVGARGRYTLTELDQGALMRSGDQMEHGAQPRGRCAARFSRAFKQITTGRPGAAHIALPFDVQNGPVKRAEIWGEPSFGRYPAERLAPDAAMHRARESLAARRGASGFYLRRRRDDVGARSRSCSSSPSAYPRRSPPRSAAKVRSTKTIRWPSASSAPTAARPRRARSSIKRI